jgi:hypothetical protein
VYKRQALKGLDVTTVTIADGDTVDRIARRELGPLWNQFDLSLIRERIQELNPKLKLGSTYLKVGKPLRVPTHKKVSKADAQAPALTVINQKSPVFYRAFLNFFNLLCCVPY